VGWRADMRSIDKPSFTAIANNAPNIVRCAADLELAYLTEKRSVTGAYQGYYIFTAPADVSGAQRLGLIHYPIFNKSERAMIDTRLRAYLKTRTNAAPSKGGT
jgi:hypothetical protein